MPIINLFPNAVGAGNDNGWTLGAGVNKQTAVQTDDADASCILAATLTGQTFDLDHLPPEAGAINAEPQLTHKSRRGSGARNVGARFKLGGVNADGSVAVLGGNYATFSATPGRPGDVSWWS